ncbi:carboxypeptidase regulatory-like domain-containing protein [Deminuibacter soli]|uniref:Carboxypeptidase regulatory-like domain-containing protein n=2 Tax=Deminuibacter soli TaxID=2291815 RepID=A0A3E1NHZ7_9BACT|nr:carboxypeptidase regulatory-like domain-containing protein [Deminuibacter soli]
MNNTLKHLPALLVLLLLFTAQARAQYVQKERDDTIRMMPKAPFDTLAARAALAEGTGTITGVAFTRQKNNMAIKMGNRILANKIKILLFPVTPYLMEYLELRKKENHRKLKYVYLSPEAFRFRLEAITNSTGEFTFPKMKPGKYYIQGVLNWYTTGSYNRYTGSDYYTNYYTREYYTTDHSDLLEKFVDVNSEGEVVSVKLK